MIRGYLEIKDSCTLMLCLNEDNGGFTEVWEDEHFRYICVWLPQNERELPSTIKREIINVHH